MLKTLRQELKTIDVSATYDVVAVSGLFCFLLFAFCLMVVLFWIQALAQAKEREAESAKHLIALEDREIGHLTGESSKIDKEQRSLGDRRNKQEVCVYLIKGGKMKSIDKKCAIYPFSVSSEPNLHGRTEAR